MRPHLVREIMSQPAITIAWDRSILAASGLMESNNIRRLPVVDEDGLLIGIVSLVAMLLKAPERLVVLIAGIIGVFFLS